MNTLLDTVLNMSDKDWVELQEQRRFWSYVDRSAGENGCWPWRGCDSGNGYGIGRYHKKTNHSHRLAYMLTYGEKLDTLTVVRHKCDNRICCNPAHLETGTHADNIRDWQTRLIDQKGEHNFASKLSEKNVFDIRAMAFSGNTLSEISKKFDISIGNVSLIVNGKAWEHSFDASKKPVRIIGNKKGNHRFFTNEQIISIRKYFDENVKTISQMAREYSVTQGTIQRIVYRKNYRDIP